MTEPTPPFPPATLPATVAWHTLPNAPAAGTALLPRDALQDGQVLLHQAFAASDAQQQAPFALLLLRSGDAVIVFVNRCAHFGVPLAARQEHLMFNPHTSITCNVHYARYRWSDGVCDRGDCEGEALIAVPLQIDAAGMVCIGPAA
jgi:nitrite reductase/ring-hydroxylating ferredoxin subunit